MKFSISWANSKNKNGPPFSGAVETDYTYNLLKPNRNGLKEITMNIWVIEINSLEELEEIQKEHGYRLIVSFPKGDKIGSITIYNGFVE